MSENPNVRYASFGQRCAASLIDTLIILPMQWLVGRTVGYMVATSMTDDYVNGYVTLENITEKASAWGTLIGIAVTWLYFSMFESSVKQATPGKMAVGIILTDMNGDRLDFPQASGRHFSKFLSIATLFIGYLAPLWTKKKQALHDLTSGCLVIAGAPHTPRAVGADSAADLEQNDEALYLSATREFSSTLRSEGLWAKVLALHDGDEEKAKFSYIRDRVVQMRATQKTEVSAESRLQVEGSHSAPTGDSYPAPYGTKTETKTPTSLTARLAGSKETEKEEKEQLPSNTSAPETDEGGSFVDEHSLKERAAKLDAALKAMTDRRKI